MNMCNVEDSKKYIVNEAIPQIIIICFDGNTDTIATSHLVTSRLPP